MLSMPRSFARLRKNCSYQVTTSKQYDHVHSRREEAKFWIEPETELVQNYGLTVPDLTIIERLIREHRVSDFFDRISSRSKFLHELYEDTDG